MESKQLLTTLLLCLLALVGRSQYDVKDSVVFSPNFSFHFGWHWPAGDMEERFGDSGATGVSFNIKDRKNFYYGVDFSYSFGTKVKEPGLLQNLYTENGEILDNEGQISVISIQERGYVASIFGGKLFPVIGPNDNSGILVKVGVGFMQHKIRIEHQENFINHLEGDYLKGYDRLTNGFAFTQFIGYYHMSNSRLANFFIGFDFVEGITEGRRDFNFDTQTTNEGKRTDILYGVKAGWFIPMYKRKPEEFYIY